MKLRRIVSCMMALLLVCSLPLAAFAEEYDLANGSITVTANTDGQTVNQGGTDHTETTPTVIKQSDSSTPTTNTITITATENATANVTIQDVNIVISDPSGSPQDHSGQAAVTIDVAENAEANVTLDGVNIDVSGTGNSDFGNRKTGEAAVQIKGNGDVTLELDGENTVQSGVNRAGVEKNTTNSSGKGNLTITDENGTDGSLKATGGYSGAGIGGAQQKAASNITITGNAEVTAKGGDYGSGIGGGVSGSGSNITITGSAEVNAQGGDKGAGIGGGSIGSGSSITITGSAEVTAIGGVSGAGIGGGSRGDGINITITGSAEVNAIGGVSGAGIGSGYQANNNATGSNITVSEDAQVKAQGGKDDHWSGSSYSGAGAAIGDGGKYSDSSPDNIAGEEKAVNTDDLNEGWVATYAPGTTDLDSATPNSLTYKGASNVAGAQPIAKQEPTCTEDGHRAGFTVNGTQVGGQTLSATGHSFTNYVPDSEATCTADATKTAQCDHAGCDITDTISVPGTKKPHSMGAYHTETPATCQKEGVERRDCDNCDYSETSPLKKVDHSYGDFASDNNATCTADGTKTRKCIWCGLKDTVSDPGTMKEHSFTNYISDKNATYEADGTKTAKCDNCDATHTIPDPGSKLVREETAQPAAPYRVVGQDGKNLACKKTQSSGVLTITVDADFATLTGSASGLKTLKAQGVETIVFVTTGATSTFALADLLAQVPSGSTYALTHVGSTVTLTLSSGMDISSILK